MIATDSGRLAVRALELMCQKRPPHGDIQELSHSLFAVRISGPVIGEFWLVLNESDIFDGEGLPVYYPSEIRALAHNGYDSQVLQALHRTKMMMEGRIQSQPNPERQPKEDI